MKQFCYRCGGTKKQFKWVHGVRQKELVECRICNGTGFLPIRCDYLEDKPREYVQGGTHILPTNRED